MELAYTVVSNLPTLARINNTTKEIQVSSRFEKFNNIQQEFILLQLESYSNRFDNFLADKRAVKTILKNHPEISRAHILASISNLIRREINYPNKIERINELTKYFKNE